MHRRQLVLTAAATAIAKPMPSFSQAGWPDRPVKLIVPFPPGGNSDALGRVLAERLHEVLKAPAFIVDNKPGGTTSLGTEQAARAERDGYTLLLAAATAFTVLPHLRRLSFALDHDFEVVGGVADYISVITVRNDLPVQTLAELFALARSRPGKLTLGSAGIASVGHINGEILKRHAGIDILHVPFKGSQDAANALLGGQIDVIIDGLGLTLARSGRARALAAFYPSRHPELPNVPSLPEAGVPVDLPGGGWGVLAPKGTPASILQPLGRALEQICAEPETRDRLQRVSVIAGWVPGPTYRRQLERVRSYYGDLLQSIGLRNEG